MHRYHPRHLARRVRRSFTPTRLWALTVAFILATTSVSWAESIALTDAVDDTVAALQNSGVNSVDVLANDSVADGGTLAISDASTGSSGVVAVVNDGGGLTYEPNTDFCGPDSFTYTVSDGLNGTDTATVAIEVTCEAPSVDETTTTVAPIEEPPTTTTTAPPVEETTTTTEAPPVEETTTTTTLVEETTTTTSLPEVPALDLATAANLIVKIAAGVDEAEATALFESVGGVKTGEIDVLRMHMVAVAPDTVSATIAAFEADPAVVSVDLDRPRDAEAVPDDPGYSNQWALPLIGWEDVFGVINPSGTSTIAVLDTGVDASIPDLAGRVVGGWSFDGSSTYFRRQRSRHRSCFDRGCRAPITAPGSPVLATTACWSCPSASSVTTALARTATSSPVWSGRSRTAPTSCSWPSPTPAKARPFSSRSTTPGPMGWSSSPPPATTAAALRPIRPVLLASSASGPRIRLTMFGRAATRATPSSWLPRVSGLPLRPEP